MIPVVAGFVLEGVPSPITIIGIVAAFLAVVLVTRAPGHGEARPSGIRWALLAAAGIGVFNIGVGQLSGATPFGSIAVFRVLQAGILLVLIVAWRQPWRMPREILPKILVIGLLDMAGNAAFVLAVGVGALAIAAVLSSLYPVTTVLLALVVLHERVTRSHAAGIALTALAVALISYGTATL
jgi:drug/metabolite transporter (DMT)-like permease